MKTLFVDTTFNCFSWQRSKRSSAESSQRDTPSKSPSCQRAKCFRSEGDLNSHNHTQSDKLKIIYSFLPSERRDVRRREGAGGVWLLVLFIFCSIICEGQNPLVKMWDKRFGGTGDDRLWSIQQTADGGYILGGVSQSSISGDKTQPLRGGIFDLDYWVVKIDSMGDKQWDKDFGGIGWDHLQSIQQTRDNGYILGGYSLSGISGDKTDSLRGGAGDPGDYWIVKIDSLGTKQWDKDFGGTSADLLYSIQQTVDGGYLFGGYSYSGIGGDKTQDTVGGHDYWIVKTDSLGNKQWDKDFGGSNDDNLRSIHQTSDGGYILGGYSWSGISGDKTQALWGIGTDYWIVKTDTLGNKQWDKDFGGTNPDELISIRQTADGGYILGGISSSGISGNKTQALWGGNGFWDYWILKTDSLGNKQWDKDFGGTEFEINVGNIFQCIDSGFLIAGGSYSPISGNKTENNLGMEQTWVVKTDSLGNIIWDKTVFTLGHDPQGLAIQTKDGCYLFANFTGAGIGGYKSQASWGNAYDYWIIKFCDSTILQSLFTAPTFLCLGTCTDFLNISFNASSYQWSFPGATPDTSTSINPTNICYPNSGSYNVQLIASNANGSDTLLLTNYITVYPSPPPQAITQSGDTLFAITGSASYQWYFNGNIINGATDYFYVAPTSGDYNVVATDANGCEVEAAIFNVVASVNTIRDQAILIFPNPVEGEFTIKNLKLKIGTAVEISVYNMLGEIVWKGQQESKANPPERLFSRAGNQEVTVDVSKLSQGMYYLEITTEEKTMRTKFLKSAAH